MSIFRVTIHGSILGQSHENVFHVKKDEHPSGEESVLATTVETQWLDQIKQFTPSDLIWTNIRVQKVTGGVTIAFNKSILVQGTSSGIEGMPTFVAFLIKLKTQEPGRRGRGRYYQSSPNPGHITAGRFKPDLVNFIAARLSVLTARWCEPASTGYQLGVCKRGALEADFFNCFELQLDTIPRHQNRRQLGVGV